LSKNHLNDNIFVNSQIQKISVAKLFDVQLKSLDAHTHITG